MGFEFPFRYAKGAYFYLPSYAMRTHGSRKQQDAVKSVSRSQMPFVYEVVNPFIYLFSILLNSFLLLKEMMGCCSSRLTPQIRLALERNN